MSISSSDGSPRVLYTCGGRQWSGRGERRSMPALSLARSPSRSNGWRMQRVCDGRPARSMHRRAHLHESPRSYASIAERAVHLLLENEVARGARERAVARALEVDLVRLRGLEEGLTHWHAHRHVHTLLDKCEVHHLRALCKPRSAPLDALTCHAGGRVGWRAPADWVGGGSAAAGALHSMRACGRAGHRRMLLAAGAHNRRSMRDSDEGARLGDLR